METNNAENVTQALAVAVVQMANPNASPLVFDGKNVSVTDLLVNNVNGKYYVFVLMLYHILHTHPTLLHPTFYFTC